MNISPSEVDSEPAERLSNAFVAVTAPAIATFILFVVAGFLGGTAADPNIVVLARFLSLMMLALAMFTAITTGKRCADSEKRWLTGQAAAASTGLAAGFVWSAAAFGFGFLFFLAGLTLGALLISGELQKRTNRRLAGQRSANDSD